MLLIHQHLSKGNLGVCKTEMKQQEKKWWGGDRDGLGEGLGQLAGHSMAEKGQPSRGKWICLLAIFPFAPNVTKQVCVQGEFHFTLLCECLQCGGKRKCETLAV